MCALFASSRPFCHAALAKLVGDDFCMLMAMYTYHTWDAGWGVAPQFVADEFLYSREEIVCSTSKCTL